MRLLTVLCLIGCAVSASAAEPTKYNIISIVTDDQAAWSLGCYGNKECRTPNMDRLAREGARFRNAFTPTPVCSPSRASMLCGRYGSEVGIRDWIADKEADAGVGLSPNVPTWPKVLHQHGYRTALIGKWHLGAQPRFHPRKNGFDRFFGFLGGPHNSGLAFMRMIRTAKWKLVRHHRVNYLDELYDLETDGGETRNLYGSGKHAAIRTQLQKRLSEWQKSFDDPLLRDTQSPGK